MVVGERKGVELPLRDDVRLGVPPLAERRELVDVLRRRPWNGDGPSGATPLRFAFVKGLRGGALVFGDMDNGRRSPIGSDGALDVSCGEVEIESFSSE